jgi:hypothetical protein
MWIPPNPDNFGRKKISYVRKPSAGEDNSAAIRLGDAGLFKGAWVTPW